MADINVYGTLKSMAEDQKVAYAKQVFDEDLNKDQHTINLELDGKVEELRDEVFGDEWVDIGHGQREAYIETGSYILPNHNLNNASSVKVRRYHVNAGEVWRLKGLGNAPTSASYCWAIYNTYNTSTSATLTLSGYLDGDSSTTAGRNNVEAEITIPSGGAMLIISYLNANASNVYIYRKSTTPLSIADKIGYKIDTWTDDEIITNTALEIGSIVPYWDNGVRYGCRGVRLNVKEGDKVLLDTYSPALFGLIFTDENRVVKALYNDRRFDGVWTAPVNGYCYIQDVLYRDNYHYASAHGHLAYMAHDARKRVAKGGDWEMQLTPRKFNEILPQIRHWQYGNDNSIFFPSASDYITMGVLNTFTLVAGRIKLENCTAPDNLTIRTRYKNTDSNVIFGASPLTKEQLESGYQWHWRIYRNEVNRVDCALRFYVQYADSSTSFDLHIDKIFLHSSSDFAELYALAQKIINGEVEVDNFYGVKEKEVDFVKNAIGLQSISDLGYNILEHGATLPIDEDGYKYGISEKARQDAYSSVYFYTSDEDLVYMPSIDFTKINNSLYKFCEAAHNLITIPDIVAEGKTISLSYAFRNCWSLKRVGDIKIIVNNLGRTFENCYALEYIGRIATIDDNNIRVSEKTSLFGNCYSLERVEELNMYRWGGNNFNATTFNNCINLRYLLIKGFGSWDKTGMGLQNVLANWGIPNDKHPDARQSLVDSLLTYSYDRVNDPDELGTAGTTCTITLSADSYAQLTTAEIEAITAKGYTLTHP